VNEGSLVISLDFELHWGVHDSRTLESYGRNLLGVRNAVPAMLDLFAEFGIHATWATVGFLFHETRAELLRNLPAIKPEYEDPTLSPYSLIKHIGENEASDPYHFAPSLIRRICQSPGQEIASHTYSHFFCMERGAEMAAFAEDLLAARRVAEQSAIPLRSVAFPRNQYTYAHLAICRQLGFCAYRGNAASALYRSRTKREAKGWMLRGAKFADAYVPFSGRNISRGIPASPTAPAMIPASRFLRPYHPALRSLDQVRFFRITSGMAAAARAGNIYHLWWHPHNVGINVAENMAFLRRILEAYSRLNVEHRMRSLNMSELADQMAVIGERAMPAGEMGVCAV
jgi:peptidoglycan/xylan/chitin deacetylase (PgdA/CDA1 family)